MPASPKTSRTELIDAALDVVEELGFGSLTMARVAKKVGIQAPSLYNHFADRKELLVAIEERLFQEVTARFMEADDPDPYTALRQMCFAFRAYALERPNCYSIMFVLDAMDTPKANEIRRRAIEPTLKHLTSLYGDDAFRRNRAITGFLHGFVSLEILHGFRLGTDPLESFSLGVDLLLGVPNEQAI